MNVNNPPRRTRREPQGSGRGPGRPTRDRGVSRQSETKQQPNPFSHLDSILSTNTTDQHHLDNAINQTLTVLEGLYPDNRATILTNFDQLTDSVLNVSDDHTETQAKRNSASALYSRMIAKQEELAEG